MRKTGMTFALSLLFAMGAMGTAAYAQTENSTQHSNHNHPQKMAKPDGSVVETKTASDGTMTETRTFKNGDVKKITRVTRADGTRTVKVEYRDRKKGSVDLTEESDIEQAMDATGDVIVTSANKAWEARYPGLFRVTDGMLRTEELNGPGLSAT